MKHFNSSLIVALIGFISAYVFLGGLETLYIVMLLSILEISLSFDNAVVNAKVLETMDPVWQKRFITYGIPIAVFGMRFLFPIVIVAVAGGLTIYNTFLMAVYAPTQYHDILAREDVHNLIYAFGGSFLLMVFLSFLLDEERETKWLNIIESNSFIKKVATADHSETVVAIAFGLFLTSYFNSVSIALAYFTGVLLHSFLVTLDDLLHTDGIRSGIVGLLYLEVLDASFSFDGVIGAFALSSDIFIIMIGLGIGAMFVRSLTLYMVEKKTLDEYKYLEHGAHYAIFALAVIMFLKMFIPVSELVVGTIGIIFIGFSLWHSIQENKQQEQKGS
jgi:hypothetical protein